MKDPSSRSSQLAVTALSLVFLSSLVLAEHFLFQQFLDRTYYNFWIEHGPLIAFSLTLIGLVWSDLDKQNPDLVSIHPGLYLIACFLIMSGLFLAFTNSLPDRQSMADLRKTNQVSTIYLFYDSFIGILFYVVLFFVAMVWFLCIAPALYFITLITGAPARLAMLNKSEQIPMVRSSTDSRGTTTSDSLILSFRDKPVTVTQALTAGFLTLVKLSGIAAMLDLLMQ